MWSSGDPAIVRFLNGGRPSYVRPVTVVGDLPEHNVLSLAAGTPTKRRVQLDGSPISRALPYEQRFGQPWRLGDGTWGERHTLLVTPVGAAHSVWLFWNEQWAFLGWYVNLQEPMRRTRLGFDTVDHVLDLWIEPDLRWSWKDEHELEAATRVGRFSTDEAAEIRAEGGRVISEWPFPTGWEDWRPDPDWPISSLPPGWDAV